MRTLLFVCLFMLAGSAWALKQSEHPRLGLVLGGGGARGLAHIGVLQELEAQGVHVDAIAGTSMGSIIAGLYAAGYRPDEIRQIALDIDWASMFSDDVPRKQRSMQRKQDDRLGLIGATAGFRQGKLMLPAGILSGQQISLLLQKLFMPRADVRDFDALPIPFRAVATDIVTGEEVVIDHGNLAEAVRSSMNVPGIFVPVEWEGHQLVDGGLVNNLPITVLRQMDVDYIIAVRVSAPMLERDRLGSVLDVTDQLTRMMVMQNEAYQTDFLTDQDLLIEPDLDEVGSADFDKAELAMEQGRKAARAFAQHLQAWAADTPPPISMPKSRPVVQQLEIRNDVPLNGDVVRHALHQQSGQPLDVQQLEQDIERLYGTGLYQKISWYLEPDAAGGDRLIVQLKGKPWGPDYVQTGLSLSNNFTGDSAYDISLRYLKTVLNPLGGEAGIYGRLGQNPLLKADYFQPLDTAQHWFVGVRAGYRKTNARLFQQKKVTSSYRLTHYGVETMLGREWPPDWRLQLAALRERGRAKLNIGVPLLDESILQNNAHLRLELLHDDLDSLYFPTAGKLLRAEWMEGRRWMGSDSNYHAIRLQARYARDYSGSVFWLGGETFLSQSEDRGVPWLQRPTLGGFLRLSGLQEQQLILGENLWLANAAWLNDVRPWLHWDSLPVPLYLGFSLEAARSRNRERTEGQYELIHSGSLFLGVDTWVGPVFLGYGRTDQGDEAMFFYLNRQFGDR